MPLRLLLILTLVAPQLALPVAMGSDPQGKCEATSCCVVVETTTCCGETVREMRCGTSGGRCYCGVRPDDSRPAPQAPRPLKPNDVGPIFVAAIDGGLVAPAAVRVQRRWTTPAVHRTHNELRALLCIWRT